MYHVRNFLFKIINAGGNSYFCLKITKMLLLSLDNNSLYGSETKLYYCYLNSFQISLLTACNSNIPPYLEDIF